MTDTPIRDAATIILLRNHQSGPSVLMGQRGAKAAFMPNKFVFPGGAVDDNDHEIPLSGKLSSTCISRIGERANQSLAHGLSVAAVRELWEETGLVMGTRAEWPEPPADWAEFAGTGHRPDASPLTFVFRAITPPGRPRRFDARFFFADADRLDIDLDDFGSASDELSHLQWIGLNDVRSFDLPFITQVVLAEVTKAGKMDQPPDSIPFFDNNDEESLFRRLGGNPL